MTIAEFDDLFLQFVGRISDSLDPRRFEHPSLDLLQRGRAQPAEWCNHPGIYSFIRAGEIVYIGRAAKDKLGKRIWDQVRPRPGTWHDLIKDPSTTVVLWAIEPIYWYWVASLEIFLLHPTLPEYNKRSC